MKISITSESSQEKKLRSLSTVS